MREREIESVQRAKISPLRHTEGFRARNPEDGPFGTLPIRRLGVGTRQAVSPAGDTHASTLREITANQSNSSGHPLLRLQQTIGNRHVQRAIKFARAADGDEEVTPEFEQAIQSARGSGQPLDSNVRAQMEPAFGADFSSVRVHTDHRADSLNRSVDARAFTTGRDIFFRQGEYKPGSTTGEGLIAHELTHVVQQKGNVYAKKLEISQPDDACEKEAKSVEEAICSRRSDKTLPSLAQLGNVAVVHEKEMETLKRESTTESKRLERLERRDKINRAIQCLDLLSDRMFEALPIWQNLGLNIGSAYNLAWHIHKDAVDKSGKEAEFREAIVLALFTAVIGGALGWLGEALVFNEVAGKAAQLISISLSKNVAKGLNAGLEDAIQAGASEVIDIYQESKKPYAIPCSFLPLNFSADFHKIFNAEKSEIHRIKVHYKERLLNMTIPQQEVFEVNKFERLCE